MTGDERIVALLCCKRCGKHYIEDWVDVGGWDDTPSEITERLFGPLAPAAAAAVLADMRTCPNPHSKYCDCPVHARLEDVIDQLPTCRILSRRS
jgi:hypothetical protein